MHSEIINITNCVECQRDTQSRTIAHRDRVLLMSLGNRIREARRALGHRLGRKITQIELGEMCGWERAQSRVSGYENNMREPSIADLDKLAKITGVNLDWLLTGKGQMEPTKSILSPEFPTIPLTEISAIFKKAPIVGTTQGGPEAYHEELGYPVGIGDGYLDNPTKDPNAYGLRVKGSSMAPRMREGDAILVSPNETVDPGDDVVIRFKNGEVMVKQLVYMRGGEVALESIGDDARIVRKMEEVEFMHYVAGIYPPKSIKYK